ncbi:hypothetical protein QEJ31_04930 [Pigmentibacter sp. JX0631]|uniref:hypothetical protein n=1 Tax=Pigmentibacter sp. JX0631 TaxID=2976982 RepID=UPI002469698C|nr:hypothetical protein [Pigmentibacter sp. JX0631]WGL60940.1 hypothetical protein QEJ31_04930 [Pigmentibacter sp. JX0631]
MEKELSFAKAQTPEQMLMQLLFHFSILMEYQLIDLQSNVRSFVEAMSEAIQKMDNLVVEEGQQANEIYENLFSKAESEAQALNQRANFRADDIFAEASGQDKTGNQTQAQTPKTSATDTNAFDKIWSEISKRIESVSRLEERLRPQVYTMIQSLNFEDIQTQRIEHALNAQKKLNEGMIKFLKKGIQNCDLKEVLEFANNLVKETKASYTMVDERKVFEQVFYEEKNK